MIEKKTFIDSHRGNTLDLIWSKMITLNVMVNIGLQAIKVFHTVTHFQQHGFFSVEIKLLRHIVLPVLY